MMKKKLLLLLVPLLISGLSGCVKYNGKGKSSKSTSPASSQVTPSGDGEGSSVPAPSSSDPGQGGSSGGEVTPPTPTPTPQPADSDELPVGTAVKVNLVFGVYGKYKGEAVNSTIESLFLEHAIQIDAKVGDLLPNDEVTSAVADSHFVSWVSYNNDGKLTEYLKVPGYDNKILYASFTGGKSGGVNPGATGGGGQTAPSNPGTVTPPDSGDLPASGYGFKFSDGSYIEAVHTNDFDGFSQYVVNNKSFTSGQTFQLYNFGEKAGWIVSIDPWSFGGDSNSSVAWRSYLSLDYNAQQYKVLQDFSVESIYIKLKYGEDQIYFQLKA